MYEGVSEEVAMSGSWQGVCRRRGSMRRRQRGHRRVAGGGWRVAADVDQDSARVLWKEGPGVGVPCHAAERHAEPTVQERRSQAPHAPRPQPAEPTTSHAAAGTLQRALAATQPRRSPIQCQVSPASEFHTWSLQGWRTAAVPVLTAPDCGRPGGGCGTTSPAAKLCAAFSICECLCLMCSTL